MNMKENHFNWHYKGISNIINKLLFVILLILIKNISDFIAKKKMYKFLKILPTTSLNADYFPDSFLSIIN